MNAFPSFKAHSSGGFVLLEVLVALLIFSFGVLGIVGLQAAMTKAQTMSKARGDAAYLAQELMGTMWGDMPNITQYSTTGCASNTRCNAIKTKIETVLPSGAVTFNQGSTGRVEINISWTPPNESTSTYSTATAIRR